MMPTNETADERATRVRRENWEDLAAIAASDDMAAIWLMGENQLQADPATGGIVVDLTDDAVRIENAQTRTIEWISLDDIADVAIERP